MLQWMGGSRRKVTTSRKSTHKRQKQYFEQRKRQQQQQMADLERHSDGKRSCNLQCEYRRSLDILSLENVSTVAQEHRTSCSSARDSSDNEDFTLINQDAIPPQVILTSDGISADHSEINEEWTPSYVTEAEYLKKVSVQLQNGNENLVGTLSELDSSKLSMSQQISVIDLLGDGGANTNTEENSLHKQEAHVAFSVEGLGQMEAETPVHSPKIPGRAGRVPATSRHLDYGFHDLWSELDIDFSPRESTIDQPFCTRNVMNVAGDPNQKFMNFRKPSLNNWNCCDLKVVSGNDELIHYNQESSGNIWNDPSFLEDEIDDLGEYKSFCTNLYQRDVDFDDCFHKKNLWNQDMKFQDWDLNTTRSTMKEPETHNMKAPPVPYPKRSTVEDLHAIRISDMGWPSTIEINHNVKDSVNDSETEENLSLLSSEESCSSAAVRGDATKKS